MGVALQEGNELAKLGSDMPDGAVVVIVGHVDGKEGGLTELGHDLGGHDLGIAGRIDAHGTCGHGIEVLVNGAGGELVGGAAVGGDPGGHGGVDELHGPIEASKQVVQHAEALDGQRADIA